MSDLSDAIRTLSGVDDLRYESITCTVTDVDLSENTCKCTPIDGVTPDFLGVILSVSKSKGFLLIPKDGSLVSVTQLSEATAFVSMVSDVDQIYLAGDENGGLIKVADLVTKINNLENAMNQIKVAFASWVVVPNDGGLALKTLASTWASSQLLLTTRANIENTKVSHGNG
jgi:hypothetical protein